MIDLHLLPKTNEPRGCINVTFYKPVYDELVDICRKESTKVSWLVRSLVNDFIDDYRKKKPNGKRT
jgi:hypothetical protein